jgi:hypothetical protein
MTLFTDMVLSLRMIEQFGNGRNLACFLWNLLIIMCSHEHGPSFKKIWKAKIHLKIKIFMWLVSQNVILTKDNLVKRKWKGSTTCAFCNENESSQHLFFWVSNYQICLEFDCLFPGLGL